MNKFHWTAPPMTEERFEKLKEWAEETKQREILSYVCLLYTSPSPRDRLLSRMPSSA